MLLRKIVNSLKEESNPTQNDGDHKLNESIDCAETHEYADGEIFLSYLANTLRSLERGPIK